MFVLLLVSALVGAASVLTQNATHMHETLGEARGLAEAMSGSNRLKA